MTGRLALAHPHLQNILIRTEEGRMIRAALIVASGRTSLSVDYPRIERRILARYTEGKTS